MTSFGDGGDQFFAGTVGYWNTVGLGYGCGRTLNTLYTYGTGLRYGDGDKYGDNFGGSSRYLSDFRAMTYVDTVRRKLW